jgi:type VI secretion system protein ImpA
MPTPATLDIDPLLAPIPGPDPAGGPLPYPDKEKLDDYRKDFDPERDLADLDPNDPQRADAKKITPRWKETVTLGTKVLASTSKDLMVATRVVEALTHVHGFAGLRDGLTLLRRLFAECGDRMYPKVEEPDDRETRASRVGWLDEPTITINFPLVIRGIEFFSAGGVAISHATCQPQGSRAPVLSSDEFKAKVRSQKPEQFARVRESQEDIAQALAEQAELVSVLGVSLAEYAPSLKGIRGALEDCARVAAEILRMEPAGEGEQAGGGDADTSGGGGGGGPLRSREDAYRRLEELASALEKLDPHSPVPFLVRRAVEMRSMQFPTLVDNLMKQGTVLDFLRTQLGVEAPPAAPQPTE